MDWPNGTAMVATYQRSLARDNGDTFPSIPDVNTFINLGLNSRPTIFGCDIRNLSAKSTAPLVVYIPNSPYTYMSNVSTFVMQYQTDRRDAVVHNAYNVATRGNSTVDPRWSQCVGCAVMSRSWHRTGTKMPDVCNDCFQDYCWNGTIDSSEPERYNPSPALKLQDLESGAVDLRPIAGALTISAIVGMWFL